MQVAALPVKYTGPNLEPTIAGSVNGQPVRMLMDTGAGVNAMTRALADQLKLSVEGTTRFVYGVGGDTRLYQAQIDEMVVGPAKSGRAWLQVIDAMGGTPAIDVIVGAPFLLQADLEVALADRSIKFFRAKNCKDTFLGYWPDPNMIVVPYTGRVSRGENPHIDVVVNGVTLDAIIDTGATTSVITLAAAKRAGLRLDAPDVQRAHDITGVGAASVAHWRAHFDKLAIGTEVISDARLGVMDTKADLAVDLLLGRDFLRTHRILFATTQKKLYISYLGGDPFAGMDIRGPTPSWLQREADEGNPDGEFALFEWFDRHKDAAQSQRWLALAASHGHKGAQTRLARLTPAAAP